MMNGNVVSDFKMETAYDDNDRIVSMITTTYGQKAMESVHYTFIRMERQ